MALIRRILFVLVFFSVHALLATTTPENPAVTARSLGTPLPKYEAGFGVATFYLPDYPGADEMTARVLPLPYVIYRGEILRADREGGLRSRILRRTSAEFDLSLSASFPSNSDNNEAREDMPDLDWLGEIGPKLVLHLNQSPMARVDVSLPVRYVFSTDFKDVHSRGFIFHPEIILRHRVISSPGLSLRGVAGLNYSTEKLMDYFYTVTPDLATPSRPEYKAEAGYFGANFSATVIKFFHPEKVAFFAGVSHHNYKGVKNDDSPLMKDRYTMSYFMGIAIGLYESEERESVAAQ